MEGRPPLRSRRGSRITSALSPLIRRPSPDHSHPPWKSFPLFLIAPARLDGWLEAIGGIIWADKAIDQCPSHFLSFLPIVLYHSITDQTHAELSAHHRLLSRLHHPLIHPSVSEHTYSTWPSSQHPFLSTSQVIWILTTDRPSLDPSSLGGDPSGDTGPVN
ncbi:hypothetical protein BO78DRAFT_132579 [Aspergillus sclerotiicarbonarius CBS 121057]|uniref:Uncharacterized protein n=1 Tax=Aspergillus sclerotiicarbonarius (strain CBS 121057 / IBT 28362) TaxID=1448318 RepID=A0A319FN21_ASPSB|nr:hypothetical protein BO78DRAFT_132579 [Aspergillus sclerotiicarbonarius CBS 121057]